MPLLDQSSPDELAARVADHPLFRDFATPLNISTATGPVEETISSLAKRVRWHRPPAVVRVPIVEGASSDWLAGNPAMIAGTRRPTAWLC
jgi:hypothetical protein